MIDQDIQKLVDRANELLIEARTLFESSDYNESERCANEAIALLEPHTERDDLGDERDTSSQKCAVIEAIAHAYNRLQTISNSRSDYTSSLSQAEIAIRFCERIGNLARKADLLGNIGVVYELLSDNTKALECCQSALAINEDLCNKSGIAANLSIIGGVYYSLSDYPKALEYYQKAQNIFEELGSESGIASTLGNCGIVYLALSEYDEALGYMLKALAIYEEIGVESGIAINLGNIGNAYQNISDYASSLEYSTRALAIYERIGHKEGIANNLDNIGSTYAKPDFDGYDPGKAEEFMLRAIAIIEQIGLKRHHYQMLKNLTDLYKIEERWKEFATHFEKYHTLKEEVQSDEAKKQAGFMEELKQNAAREKLQLVERTQAQATQDILHKVLPQSIADRLVRGEKVADYFDRVSILFADIVGFTPIASRMPAKAVLAFLNHVFGEFDRIVKLCGCEKIKTIGDGYLALAGAPIECSDHAERIARCALEMMNDIELPDEIRKHLPKGSQFSLRIGVHTGSVFAGIVGEERFVYDIYSDAVNIAARMESHGEAGRIHVSDEFCFHLQNRMETTREDLGGIRFDEREAMEIKGKGIMKTYFLERANV